VFASTGFREDARKTEAYAYRERFGDNIAALRRRRKLTEERLAERVDVSPRYIQSIEAGDYFPILQNLVRLCGALKCVWNNLFAGCGTT
jgi:transcriptional regulator with XRE-family HTH domain